MCSKQTFEDHISIYYSGIPGFGKGNTEYYNW